MIDIDPRMAARRRSVREQRIRRGVRRLLTLLTAAGALAAGWWVAGSPLLDVERVSVVGAESSDASEIVAEAGLIPGVPMVAVDAEGVEAALTADPWIAGAAVERRWPDAVVAEVRERRPAAWVKTADGWVLAAHDGVVLVTGGEPPSGAPTLIVARRRAGSLAGDPEVIEALAFLAALDPSRQASARFGPEGLRATVDGFEVRLGPGDGEEKARALEAVLDTGPEPGSVITLVAPSRPAVLPPG